MRVTLLTVGRLRKSPESALVDFYLQRFDAAGRGQTLGPSRVVEVEDRKNLGSTAESALLLEGLPKGALLVALDERGKTLTSPQFAQKLGQWRDAGVSDVCFALGGADGHDETLRNRADFLLSFGAMVWPHMLARVMLSEQLYRAAAILAGHPYHRS